MKKRIFASVGLIMLVSIFLIATPTRGAKFVLAAWDYPDDYGQGIESIYVAHNKSGSFVDFAGSPYSRHVQNLPLYKKAGRQTSVPQTRISV